MRWYLKKATRHGLALLSWGSGYLALQRWLGSKPRIRALTYHRFRSCRHDPFSVDAERFEEQIRWLADQRLAISLSDLEAFLGDRRQVPEGSVLVTIDDGYEEIWSVAVPILQRYGVPAVVFVPTADVLGLKTTGQASAASGDDGPRLSPQQLLALSGSAVEVGSHSWQHRSLGRMNLEEVRRQVTRSKHDLEGLLGRSIAAFAYPFGTWKDFNSATTGVLSDVGYRLGFTSQHGSIVAGADPLQLPRIKVEGGESLRMFKLLVSGALDSWSLVDRSLWWLQRSETTTPGRAGGRTSSTGSVEA